jgi:hypothetical protein
MRGFDPTLTVCRIAPAASSLRSVPAKSSATQTFVPSNRGLMGLANPDVTVVTVQGIEAAGVTMDIEAAFPVQMCVPS